MKNTFNFVIPDLKSGIHYGFTLSKFFKEWFWINNIYIGKEEDIEVIFNSFHQFFNIILFERKKNNTEYTTEHWKQVLDFLKENYSNNRIETTSTWKWINVNTDKVEQIKGIKITLYL